jgi:subtilisin family serine protease
MLYRQLQQPEFKYSNNLRSIIVKGNPAAISKLVSKYGGVYKFSAGDISSLAVPYKNLLAFSREIAVERIEAQEVKAVSLMDSARIKNNIDSAHNGYAPLTQAYKGAGVLVGIIDGGIYFRHQDFKRPNGNTRIRYLWDQTDTAGPHAQPYAYGTDWDSTSINGGTCRHRELINDQGHGTNVAGIAVGNGSSFAGHPFLNNRYTGAAPEADLIVVSVDNTRSDYLQTVADAVDYIFRKADLLGMPCVINTSIGTYYGPHDGSELSVRLMENLLDQKTGRVLVASAGNAGNVKHHLSYPLSATDSLFTWFSYNSTSHKVYYDLWADTAQFRSANFAIGCDNNTPAFLARSRYYNAVTDFHPAPGVTVQIDDTLFQGTTLLGTYTIATTLYNGLYHIEFLISPVLTTYLWRLQTIGQGTFDLWANKSLIGTSSSVLAPLPGGFTSPNYRFTDTLKTLVSAWQCSDKVITVANYSNRANYLTKDSLYIDLTASPYFETVGALIPNSSNGPTRDGRIKPDIAATGNTTTATGDSTYIATLIGAGNGYKVAYGSKHTRNGGTSMSSPLVAGVVALYLQEHPRASYREVKQVLEITARRDNFTTFTIPNNQFGWGKVDAFEALKYPVVYGCMDTGSINYNPSANIDTGGCVPKIYGITDTSCLNYNPLANFNSGVCVPKVYGIMDTSCINYNHLANVSSGVCVPKVYGITDTSCINYNHLANVSSGVCVPKVYGIMDTSCINYNHLANISSGTCVPKVYGITDTSCINYNHLANVSSGICVPKVYGITDTSCINYNHIANVSSGVCIHMGIDEVNSDLYFDIAPNPFSQSTTIRIECSQPMVAAAFKFYDLMGREVDAITVPTGVKELTYKNNKLASGIYNAILTSDGRIVAIRKVVID